MLPVADPRGAEAHAACFLLRERDQLLHGARRHGRMCDEHVAKPAHEIRDGREVFLRVVRELLVHASVDHEGSRIVEQRVAVRRGFRNDIGPHDAIRACAVIDHDRLPHLRFDLPRERARVGVDRAAGDERHHEADGPTGVRLCRGEPAPPHGHEAQHDHASWSHRFLPGRRPSSPAAVTTFPRFVDRSSVDTFVRALKVFESVRSRGSSIASAHNSARPRS